MEAWGSFSRRGSRAGWHRCPATFVFIRVDWWLKESSFRQGCRNQHPAHPEDLKSSMSFGVSECAGRSQKQKRHAEISSGALYMSLSVQLMSYIFGGHDF